MAKKSKDNFDRQLNDKERQQLQREVVKLKRAICHADTVEDVLDNGFASLTAQLAPLRDLTPKRIPMSDGVPLRKNRVLFIGKVSPATKLVLVINPKTAKAVGLTYRRTLSSAATR